MDDTIVVRWRFHFTLDGGTDPLPAELFEEEAQLKYDILPCARVEFGPLIPEMPWPEPPPITSFVRTGSAAMLASRSRPTAATVE